jgi:hypothetical protein
MIRSVLLAAAVVCAGASLGCTREVQAMTPQTIARQYGVPGAYSETVSTADGSLAGTIVPVTLADGRAMQLFSEGRSRPGMTRSTWRADRGLPSLIDVSGPVPLKDAA